MFSLYLRCCCAPSTQTFSWSESRTSLTGGKCTIDLDFIRPVDHHFPAGLNTTSTVCCSLNAPKLAIKNPLLRRSCRFLFKLRLTCTKIPHNTKHGSYCFLLRSSRAGCTVLGWAPGKQWSLRTCGMLGAKWARSWAAYWALWRRRIVTSLRPRPFFKI